MDSIRAGRCGSSAADPAILEDFKLIDFEYSGLVDTPYPFVALKNDKVRWHQDFNSYAPRKFEHDQYMLDNMNSEVIGGDY